MDKKNRSHIAKTLKQILGKHTDTPVAGSLFGKAADKMSAPKEKYHRFFVGFINKGKKKSPEGSESPPTGEKKLPSLFVGFITKGRKKRKEPSSTNEQKDPSMLAGLRNLNEGEKKKKR